MNFTKIAYIYGLVDEARPDDIRYVGKAVNPRHRLSMHLIPYALKKNTYKNNWAKSVLREGRRIVMRILCIVPQDSWEKAERECIAFCSTIHRLTNGNEGGEGGGEPAPWVKDKMRVAGIARGAREREVRAQRANRMWADPSYRLRMSKAHKGKKQSAELVAKRIRPKAVVRLDTGERFSSIKAAAHSVGAPHPSALTQAMKRKTSWRGIWFQRAA